MFISVHGVFLISLSMYLQYQKDEIKVGGWVGITGWGWVLEGVCCGFTLKNYIAPNITSSGMAPHSSRSDLEERFKVVMNGMDSTFTALASRHHLSIWPRAPSQHPWATGTFTAPALMFSGRHHHSTDLFVSPWHHHSTKVFVSMKKTENPYIGHDICLV